MLKVGEAKEVKVMLLDDDGNPTSGTISYTVYDEGDSSFATGTMTAISGVTGLYTMSFTPDAAGAWSVVFVCSSPSRTAVKMFDVGVGVEQASYDAIVVLSTALTTHDTDIKALLATVQADLDTPNQYKADISTLALEATLTSMKGVGWSTETLKVIKDALDALNNISANDIWTHGTRTLTDPDSYKANVSALALEATLNTHDTDIKNLINALNNITVAGVWGYGTRTLTDPNSYKADVSALALEATLTAMKGGGWSTETLKAIYDLIAGLNDLAQSDILADATPFNGADIATILSEIQSGTYGLSALNTDLDAIISSIGTPAADLAADIAAIKTVVDNIEGYVDTEVGAIKDKTDNLPTDPASRGKIISRIDLWSEGVVTVNIPATADQDINLPDVVVPALPTGVTIWKVHLLFKCALIKDTSGSDNAIDEAGVIRIKKDGDATFDGNGIDAYVIEDNKWSVDVSVSAERGGDAFVGKTDLSSKVDGADTYNLRLDSISADGTNLVLVDVCVGLRIYFY